MGPSLIVETSFLVDLEREHTAARLEGSWPSSNRMGDARLYLSFIVARELEAGAWVEAY